jgi:hypothetical protein
MQPIYQAIRTYVQELRSGLPGKPGNSSSTGSAAAAAAGGSGAAVAAAANSGGAARPGSNDSGSAAAKKASKRSVDMTEKFYARRQDIYDCFTVQVGEGLRVACTALPLKVQRQKAVLTVTLRRHLPGALS